MKEIIERILLKFNYVPYDELRHEHLRTNQQWKKIILNPVLLAHEQNVAKAEQELLKGMTDAFFSNGTSKPKRRKTTGVKLH